MLLRLFLAASALVWLPYGLLCFFAPGLLAPWPRSLGSLPHPLPARSSFAPCMGAFRPRLVSSRARLSSNRLCNDLLSLRYPSCARVYSWHGSLAH